VPCEASAATDEPVLWLLFAAQSFDLNDCSVHKIDIVLL